MNTRFVLALATVTLLFAGGAVGSAAATSDDVGSLSEAVMNEEQCMEAAQCSIGEATDQLLATPMNEEQCMEAAQCSLGEASDELVTTPMNEEQCMEAAQCSIDGDAFRTGGSVGLLSEFGTATHCEPDQDLCNIEH